MSDQYIQCLRNIKQGITAFIRTLAKDHITDIEHDKNDIAITATKPTPLGEVQTNRISLISLLKDGDQNIC